MKGLWILFICMGSLASEAPRKHQVDSQGHAMTVWEKRPAQARASILLIHGRTWSALPDFDLKVPNGENLSLMDSLTAHGFAVYALDMRGYGSTPRDTSGWLSPNKAVQDITAVLKWVDTNDGVERKPALFGWSFGSTLSQLTAQASPDLMSHLILFGYWYNPNMTFPENPDPAAPERRKNNWDAAISDFKVPGSISQAAIDAFAKACLKHDPVRVDVRRLHQFNALDASKVKVPTLLIQGEHDHLTNTMAHAQVFTQLGHAQRSWVVLEGGDHAAHIEKPRDHMIRAMVASG